MEVKIQARIDPDLKKQGEEILKELGVSTTELVRMTFRQLVMRNGITKTEDNALGRGRLQTTENANQNRPRKSVRTATHGLLTK